MLTTLFIKKRNHFFFNLTKDKAKIENNILRLGTYLSSVVEMHINAFEALKRDRMTSEERSMLGLENRRIRITCCPLQAFFFSLLSKICTVIAICY